LGQRRKVHRKHGKHRHFRLWKHWIRKHWIRKLKFGGHVSRAYIRVHVLGNVFSGPIDGHRAAAIMQILAAAPTVGIAIDTRALSSTLGYGSPIDANFQWNFGDPNGEYNTLPGFNASHIYTSPGDYTITLTVTNRCIRPPASRQSFRSRPTAAGRFMSMLPPAVTTTMD